MFFFCFSIFQALFFMSIFTQPRRLQSISSWRNNVDLCLKLRRRFYTYFFCFFYRPGHFWNDIIVLMSYRALPFWSPLILGNSCKLFLSSIDVKMTVLSPCFWPISMIQHYFFGYLASWMNKEDRNSLDLQAELEDFPNRTTEKKPASPWSILHSNRLDLWYRIFWWFWIPFVNVF